MSSLSDWILLKGLFLVGLLIFLWNLHHLIFIAATTVTGVTATIYFSATIVPLFSSFCPYETPLSGHVFWGYCYQWCRGAVIYMISGWFFDITARADFGNHTLPCKQSELAKFNSTSPDDLTGHALKWIIMHSQLADTREMAIRAISGLRSKETLQQLVAKPPGILPQVIQSFTSCFGARPRAQGEELYFNGCEGNIDEIALHGQALTTLINQLVLTSDRTDPEYLVTWGVDDDAIEAVEERFQL